VRYWRERLRDRLAFADPRELVEAIWLLDRLRAGSVDAVRRGFEAAFLQAATPVGSQSYIGPWELETLLLEYLEVSPANDPRRTLALRHWRVIADFVNWIRGIENEQSKSRSADKIFEELVRIGYRQFGYQVNVPDIYSTVRWWSIVNTPDLRDVLEQKFGIEFKKILRTFLVIFMYFDEDCFRLFPSEIDAKIANQISIKRVLKHLSCELSDIRSDQPCAYMSDLAYRESPIRRHPIVRFDLGSGNHGYSVPLRNLLWWRITSGLYYDLVGLPEFQNSVGRGFEAYIANLIGQTMQWELKERENYRLAGQHWTEEPDCVFMDGAGRVLAIVECKAVKATLGAQVKLLSEAGIDRAIAELAKGIVQVAKYRQFLAETQPQTVDDNCVLLVVTLDNWLFLGDSIADLVKQKALLLAQRAGLKTDLIEAGRVVLATAADLEQVVGHYGDEDFKLSYLAACGECRGYQFGTIPHALGLQPSERKAFFGDAFDGLLEAQELGLTMPGS
jgi:hypothetical protein